MSDSAPESDPLKPLEPSPVRLRGLWGLMQQAPDNSVGVESEAEPTNGTEKAEADSQTPVYDDESATGASQRAARSLWEVMGAAYAHPGDVESAEDDINTDGVVDESSEPHDSENEPEAVVEETLPPVSVPTASTIRPAKPAGQQDWLALGLGISALPLSGLAFLPGLAGSSPSALCAFAAIGIAFLVWSQSQSTHFARLRSLLGAVAALLALALGPFLFAPWGNAYRDRLSVRSTQLHLEEIGRGLKGHHEAEGSYPTGGTMLTGPSGKRRGGHGWMTRLLPYIGQTEVYDRIDLTRPYDDPINRPAMGNSIEAYYASGGDRRTVANGFAVSHFAGVGGSIVSSGGEELGAGIFDLGRTYRERDIVDGLANTWIVGELPGGYPPWGDPENWRTVTKGINRDSRGFGNAAGTGAMCLFADGSVRFLSNQTDVDLLRRLSTRDGNDLSQ